MFVTSDRHFWHDKVLDFQAHTRPFSSLEEMHEAYIKEWNACATKPGVKMFHLGILVLVLKNRQKRSASVCKVISPSSLATMTAATPVP